MKYGVIMKVQLDFNFRDVAMLLLVSLMSFISNLPEDFMGTYIDRRLVLAALIGVVVVALFRYLQVFLLLVICILAIGANLPAEMADSLGISQLALMISLGVLVALTLINRRANLLPTGIEPDEPDYSLDLDTESESPVYSARRALLHAIAKGDVVSVKGLLAMNVGVNFVQEGTTPLHLAADRGYVEIVQLLINHGASPRALNASGQTPLEIALDKKNFIQTTEILFNASRPALAVSGQAESRRGEDNAWRNQHI
jgi:lysylphosphatidylglycerol synthetase-like protein (DUF2156 family)